MDLNIPCVLPHTAISRKVIGKTVHATILKGNMGYDQYTANICPWPLLPLFEISLKNSELKPPTIPFGIVACTFSNNLS